MGLSGFLPNVTVFYRVLLGFTEFSTGSNGSVGTGGGEANAGKRGRWMNEEEEEEVGGSVYSGTVEAFVQGRALLIFFRRLSFVFVLFLFFFPSRHFFSFFFFFLFFFFVRFIFKRAH